MFTARPIRRRSPIDDSKDLNGYTEATLDTGKLTGVAPGTITWDALDALVVSGGSGGNDWTIDGGAANGVTGTTTLNVGGGSNTVNVDSTTAGFTYNLVFPAGDNALYFGSYYHLMSYMQGLLNVEESQGTTLDVTLDDSLAGKAETIGMTSSGISGLSYAGANGTTPGTLFPFSIFRSSGPDQSFRHRADRIY